MNENLSIYPQSCHSEDKISLNSKASVTLKDKIIGEKGFWYLQNPFFYGIISIRDVKNKSLLFLRYSS